MNLTKAYDGKRPWWKQSGPADRVWRHVGNRKLVDNDDGERKLVWKEHLGNASLWTESGCGAMSKYNYDDQDNHEERKQNRSSRNACGRLTRKNEGRRGQVFTSAVATAVHLQEKLLNWQRESRSSETVIVKESRKSASDRRGNLDESWETTGSEQNEKKNVNAHGIMT